MLKNVDKSRYANISQMQLLTEIGRLLSEKRESGERNLTDEEYKVRGENWFSVYCQAVKVVICQPKVSKLLNKSRRSDNNTRAKIITEVLILYGLKTPIPTPVLVMALLNHGINRLCGCGDDRNL